MRIEFRITFWIQKRDNYQKRVDSLITGHHICFVCMCPAVGGEWCPNIYTYDSGSDTCFKVAPFTMTWDNVLDVCNAHTAEAHLVVINDAAKQTADQNFLQGQHIISYRSAAELSKV